MLREGSLVAKIPVSIAGRVKDYTQLLKPNLSLMIVFSSVIGYLLAPGISFDYKAVLALFTGGMLVTGSANTINQILERNTDRLMKRTATRPLPEGRMGLAEAWALAAVSGVGGVWLVGVVFNPLAGLLSAISLVLYAFAYTPMKRVGPIAVFVGAIPGAMPPLIGWAAATSGLELAGWSLFLLQFFWQFPHFWAIGWLGFEEYEKAGIRMLPSRNGKTKFTGMQCAIYSIVLFPLAILPHTLGITGNWGMLVSMLAAVFLFNACVEFYRANDARTAKRTMFASLIYLPVVLLALLFDKL